MSDEGSDKSSPKVEVFDLDFEELTGMKSQPGEFPAHLVRDWEIFMVAQKDGPAGGGPGSSDPPSSSDPSCTPC